MEETTRPLSLTILACLIFTYAIFIIGWDLVAPFARDYTQGPASVVFGLRVFGWSAQLMHGLQLLVALRLAYGLWTMRAWGWAFAMMVVGYIVISTTVWVAVYQDFGRIMFAFVNLVIVNMLLLLTVPHRDKFR